MSAPYPPGLYAALHAGNPGDTDYYAKVCEGADSVLELGCGFGRMLPALAAQCPRVVGLDNDEGLLKLATARELDGVELVLADMSDFAVHERFDRVVLPYSGLFCLLSPEQVLGCFRSVAAHLNTGGVFVLDAYTADAFHDEADPDEWGSEDWLELTTIEVDGRSFAVFERSTWQREDQRIDVTYRHVPHDGGPLIDCTIAHRYLLNAQLRELLGAAGLTVSAQYSDFTGGTRTRKSDLWVAHVRLT